MNNCIACGEDISGISQVQERSACGGIGIGIIFACMIAPVISVGVGCLAIANAIRDGKQQDMESICLSCRNEIESIRRKRIIQDLGENNEN